jgi:hypothetical protein
LIFLPCFCLFDAEERFLHFLPDRWIPPERYVRAQELPIHEVGSGNSPETELASRSTTTVRREMQNSGSGTTSSS